MRLRLTFTITSVISVAAFCGTASAATVTRYVNNGSRSNSCPGQYSTIQAAVNAANTNDTVFVCNGIYPEQVVIATSLTLSGQSGATIQPVNAVVNANDGVPAIAVVYVTAPAVTVDGLIIDGSQANVSSSCSPDFLGIYYSGSGGSIVRNTVRFIEQPPILFGCQNGLAIVADNPGGTSISLTIQGNSVHDFQKNGITVTGDGLTTTISGNTVLGVGPNTQIGQNGIQVGPGGTGSVTGNNASGFAYSPCTTVANCGASATGILVYDAAGVSIASNTLGQSQGAVYVFSDDGTSTNSGISKNAISDTLVYDGIGVGAGGNTIASNTIVNSAESGVALYAGGNQVNNNTIIEAPAGILIAAAGNSTPSGNKNFQVVQPIETSIPAPTSARHVQPFHKR